MSAKIRLETPSGRTLDTAAANLRRYLEHRREYWPAGEGGFEEWAQGCVKRTLAQLADQIAVRIDDR